MLLENVNKLFHLEYLACPSLTSAGPGPRVEMKIHLLFSEYLNVTSEAHNLLNKLCSILL